MEENKELSMQVVDLLKVLADDTRLRVLMLLRDQPLCVSQIQKILDLPQSTLSKHLAKLREAQLVKPQKDGKFVKYHLVHHYLMNVLLYDIYYEGKEEIFDQDRAAIVDFEDMLTACQECLAHEKTSSQ
ncbi:metalloregulator ArsR/SmtB family transcription factor [Ignavigranum ruoffiae]|uniref:ArsR/SmtB family transcription factor n=1 Tax=Ignavigranum ruoffiae TaxID=89093 RepID=UPI00217E2D82|nr:metalloregulator ArsR/SmtB family transcription factor [Ignavigranum ruoffiae]UPQ85020.2 metalloregulator ArsR/SmtB family transcription factor [Ignavigranum ruoffiae]